MWRVPSMSVKTMSGDGWIRNGENPPPTSRSRPDLIAIPGERFLLKPNEQKPSARKLNELIAGNDLIVAPVALNPIMARLAEEAGFKAIYLSGASLGLPKCGTEAHLTLPELGQGAVDQ